MSTGHDRPAGKWLIRGARPLAGPRADILIDGHLIAEARDPGSGDSGQVDQDVFVIDADGRSRFRTGRPAHAPAGARQGGRGDGRERDRGGGARRFTAIHAMANTDPVADTAGVAEQVWRLGKRRQATSAPWAP
jgi:dihydroorotase